MVDMICRDIMDFFHKMRQLSTWWESRLCPKPDDLRKDNINKSRGLFCIASPQTVFDVLDDPTVTGGHYQSKLHL